MGLIAASAGTILLIALCGTSDLFSGAAQINAAALVLFGAALFILRKFKWNPMLVMVLCGAAGGFIFEWFGLPGGAMTGAIIAVILLKSFSSLPQAAFPRPFQFCIYAGLGVLVGNMYRPEMLLAVRDTWPVLVISTLLVLVAGMLIAIFVVKFGNLDVTSAYLATSPGGLNVVVGLAADMGPNAPIVLAYQMVRLYTIILTVPLAARILHKFLS